MLTASQLSWIITRMVGLVLLFQCLTILPAVLSSSILFARFHQYSGIAVESAPETPQHRRDTPQNWRLHEIRGDALRQLQPLLGMFLVTAVGSAYCLLGGRALHKVLMPPEEQNAAELKTEPASPADG